jgi:hypothetical protein
MTIVLRMRRDLVEEIRADLRRPHAFAHERVGFVSARAARLGRDGAVILARAYHPVDDADYLHDCRVGAMMGAAAIRKALEIAYVARDAMIHVHLHDHSGVPVFSRVDLTESNQFMLNFFNVVPHMPHCAVVLSANEAVGRCWRSGYHKPIHIDEIVEVGAPMRISGGK